MLTLTPPVICRCSLTSRIHRRSLQPALSPLRTGRTERYGCWSRGDPYHTGRSRLRLSSQRLPLYTLQRSPWRSRLKRRRIRSIRPGAWSTDRSQGLPALCLRSRPQPRIWDEGARRASPYGP